VITDDDIARLRVIEGAASRGPWLVGGYFLRYRESADGEGLPWKHGRCYACRNSTDPCAVRSTKSVGRVLHLVWTKTHEGHPTVTSGETSEVIIDGDCDRMDSRPEDLAFIAASREWIPKLLDEVERLGAALRALQG
jgi:hypothetical protein